MQSVSTDELLADFQASLPRWSAVQAKVGCGELGSCADFPRIARRHEDWWARKLSGGPILIARGDAHPDRPVTRRLDLLDQPGAWLEQKLLDQKQMVCVGDALPTARVDLGAATIGALWGAPIEFGADTTWTHASINDDWSNAPDWTIDPDNHWWKRLRELIGLIGERATGNFLVTLPDLGGPLDAILNMRGPEHLCMDAIEQPRRILDVLEAALPSWLQAMTMVYDEAASRGVGLVHWLEIWSDRPYAVPTCDFNYMIGPQVFRDVCLGHLDRLSGATGRNIYHLDGPGATRHIDALLELEHVQAIQFTPGEGTPSNLPWIEMFRRIQERGRSLYLFCLPQEVEEICRQVDTRSLALHVTGRLSPDEARSLCRKVHRGV